MKPMPGTFTIHGAAELEKVLRQLPNQTRGQILRTAVMAGAREVRDAMRLAAPVGATGTLRKSIVARTQKSDTAGNLGGTLFKAGRFAATVFVGPTAQAFYGLFSEFGTSTQPARPWMRPAWEASKGRAFNIMGATLGPAIERAALRLAGPLRKSGLVRGTGRRRRR